jgi:hypothetical protein
MTSDGVMVPRATSPDVGIPTLASMLEQLRLEAPRQPLDEQVEVDGETYPVDGIRELFRSHGREISAKGSTLEDIACVLVPEAWNPDDGNAVAVVIASRHVGYLPAELATDYSQCLGILADRGLLATGNARIWAKDEGDVVRVKVTVFIPDCAVFT